jgi:DNA polymerase-3 subunit delta
VTREMAPPDRMLEPGSGADVGPETVAILLVHGEDRHRVDQEVARWRETAASAQLGIEVIDPPTPMERVRSALAEVPLIDEHRYVLLRDPPQLVGGRRGGEGGRDLASALELRAPSTAVCLVAHQQIPASHPVLAAVSRLGGTVLQRSPLRGRELRAWIGDAAARRRVRLPAGGVEHLLRVAGPDLGIISGELDKLRAFGEGGGAAAAPAASGGSLPSEIDMEALRRLVGGAEAVEIWNVLERLLGAQPALGAAAAIAMMDEGRSAIYLIATLAGQLSELRRVQALLASGAPPAALAGRLHIPEWRAERLARQARALAPEIVESWLRRLHSLDVAVKSGEADDREGVTGFALAAARSLEDQKARRRPTPRRS